MNIPKYLIVHHEAPPVITNAPRFQVVNEYHRQKFGMKSSLGYWVGYQYFIEKNGLLFQARADNEEGAHTIGHNKDSIGICLAGNFDLELPTEAQKQTLKNFLKRKMQEYNIPLQNVVPHRLFANKTCYGYKLSDDWARNLASDINVQLSLLQKMLDEIKRKVALLLGKKIV